MILDQFRLDGKVAIVTGATAGIGQAIAGALAEAGADIVGVGSSGKFDDTAAAVQAAGKRFQGVQADLSVMDSIGNVVTSALEAFERIDILVNNAGTIRRAPSLEFTEKDWDDVMNLNLKVTFFLSQA